MLKIISLLTIIGLTACSANKELAPVEIEQEFAQSAEPTVHELTDVKNPEKFVKYYLRSKFNLYNSKSLESIANSHYKLALENPENMDLQENAFLLLLANQNYAKALNITKNKPATESIAFENLFAFSQSLAQGNNATAEKQLDNILKTQHRLPFLKIIKQYFEYTKHQNIKQLEKNILAIKSSIALDGFKHYYIARAYEAKKLYNQAFKHYYLAFKEYKLRTQEVFTRMVYTAKIVDKKSIASLLNSNSAYGKNIYLVDQTFVDLNDLKPIKNTTKDISAQAFYDLGWSITQTTADLSGLDFLALADYIVPNDKQKFELAKGYYANSWSQDAIDLLKTINQKSEYYLSAQIILADIVKQKDSKKAIAILNNLKKQGKFNDYYIDKIIGQIYLNNDQFKKAIASFNKTLKHEKLAKVYFSRAIAYEKTGQIKKALADLNSALEKNSRNPVVLNYLGYLLIDLNQDPKQGLDYIKQAVRLNPTSPASLDSLGWAYIKLKEYKKGLAILEKAYTLNSQDGVITGHLADAYLYNNRKAEAIIYWKKALELETDDQREIDRIKKQLQKHNN